MNTLPTWTRAVVAAERVTCHLATWPAIGLAANLTSRLCESVLIAWTPPGERDRVTAGIYDRQLGYVQNREFHEMGLFEWEKAPFERAQVGAGRRVLVCAAGGGREVAVFAKKGATVCSFEPAEPLQIGADRVARELGQPGCLLGSYADFVEATLSGAGPLASLMDEDPFDAIILGWDSLQHVLVHEDRVQLLLACRRHSPSAHVFASFALRSEEPAAGGPFAASRRLLDKTFQLLGAPAGPEPGLHFFPQCGFLRAISQREAELLAQSAGYAVEQFQEHRIGNARQGYSWLLPV